MSGGISNCKGFLTKSPPEHKMNRARWQRRWFVLRKLQDQVLLEYYKDKTESKLKGTIRLSDCQQVDQGLSFESKRKYHNAHIFDVVTAKRKYYLVTHSEDDMQRWVESICRACGFKSEDDQSMSDAGSYIFPPGNRSSTVSDDTIDVSNQRLSTTSSVRSEPLHGMQIPRDTPISLNCARKNDYFAEVVDISSNSLPNNIESNYLISQQQQGPLDVSSSDSSSSSLHDPASQSYPTTSLRGTSGISDQVYDVPPVKSSLISSSVYQNHRCTNKKDPMSTQFEKQMSLDQEDSTKESDEDGERASEDPRSNYSIVPPPRQRMSCTEPDESIYDVPPSALHKKKPEVPERTYQMDSIYDVPSSAAIDKDSIYDMPPVPMPQEPPPYLDLSREEPPIPLDSTIDKKPLKQSNSTDELAKSLEKISMLNAERLSTEFHSATEDIYDVPRNANVNPFTDHRLSSSPNAAPPRPPKPANLEGPPLPGGSINPPLNFADTGFADTYLPTPDINDNQPLSNGLLPPPQPSTQGHHWLENRVPTPRKYLNVRDPPIRVPPIAGKSPAHASHSPLGYIPMQGSNSSSNIFQYPDENYMPMDGLPIPFEKGPELYTAMDGTEPQPPQPLPRMSTSSNHVFNDDLPPPVDRSSKPGRHQVGSATSSVGSSLPPDSRGLNDSYYATDADIGIPVRNSRTKSFSREGPKRSHGSPLGTPKLLRNKTVQPKNLMALSDEFPASIEAISEDTYVLHDKPFTESSSSDLASNFPLSPSQITKDKIEYLEIAHDSKSKSPLPLTPSKVEYITIDNEKTQALQTIQQNREKSYKGT